MNEKSFPVVEISTEHAIAPRVNFYAFTTAPDEIIGRASLIIIENKLHRVPYGFIEDVRVDDDMKGHAVGRRLVLACLHEAVRKECYKVIWNCKPDIFEWYRQVVEQFNQGLVEQGNRPITFGTWDEVLTVRCDIPNGH